MKMPRRTSSLTRCGMRLRVGEAERRAPRAAEHQPALDAEVLAQLLHVRDQMPGRVVDQTGVRPAAPAAALIEQHDAIGVGIEEAAGAIVAAGAGAAVHEHRGLARRVAAFLVVDLVHVATRAACRCCTAGSRDTTCAVRQSGLAGRLRFASTARRARLRCLLGAGLRTLRRGVLRLLAISTLRTGNEQAARIVLYNARLSETRPRNTRCSLTWLPSSCC